MTQPDPARRAARGALLAAILFFAAVALAVQAGWTAALDDAGVLWFRRAADPALARGPDWLALAMRDWTALGGRSAQSLLVAFAAAILHASGRRGAALFLLAAVLGGWALGPILKALFDRPRPEVAAHLVEVASPSFPSSHATQAAAGWLGLAAVLAAERRAAARVLPFALAAALVVVIGVSRTFLGVHFPSDVLAGWCAGAAWVAALVLVALRRSRRPPEASY